MTRRRPPSGPVRHGEQWFKGLVDSYVQARGSLRALAAEWECSAMYICDLRRGRRRPGPKLLKHLGIRKIVTTTVEYET